MRDLRLVGLSEDGARVVLADRDGEQYSLPVDERLHAALRGDRARLGQLQITLESQLRPREIQARIRAGQSAEQVADAAGVPLDRVRRYEGPVLLERAHMAEQARAVGVRRVTDATTTPLGELVAVRLEARGVPVDTLVWDSYRREDGRWHVTLTYPSGAGAAQASWLFDPLRRLIEPDDAEAGWLTDEERAVPGPRRATPRLQAVPDTGAASPEGVDAEADAAPPPDADAPVPGQPEPAPTAEAAEPAPAAPDEGGRRRPSRSRRASVPSWDEILFGSAPHRDGE